MLDLYRIAEWARLRAQARASVSKDDQNPRMFAALHRPVNERLLEACQRVPDNPKGATTELFIAAPERLLSKLAYMTIEKPKKDDEAGSGKPAAITDAMIASLHEYEADGQSASFSNLERRDQLERIRSVLLCHGLSPIGDSILLLADIGRGYRISRVMESEMRVMLADISWMSSNRSIRQFASLSREEIDTGLRVCLDKRGRLYSALSIVTDRHEIVPYNRGGKINGKKLEHISNRYTALSRLLWGDINGRLEHQQVRRICRSLDKNIGQGDDGVPPAIETLGQFRGVLAGLENTLKPHLEILRVIAKEFNAFEDEVFRYFFAQTFRDRCLEFMLKCALVSIFRDVSTCDGSAIHLFTCQQRGIVEPRQWTG